MYLHSLNPLNVSEGGDILHSPQGEALERTVTAFGPRTILYRPNLMYPGWIGETPIVATARPSLPLLSNRWPGPISLGPAQQKS